VSDDATGTRVRRESAGLDSSEGQQHKRFL